MGAHEQADPEPLRGTVIGRYVALSRLGAGAMGVVYAAYDPKLDRKVALKLLHSQSDERPDDAGHRRLLREAQAMAKLSHPHIVAVYDVGEHEGRVFVAMEFIEGRTLSEWLIQENPRWPEVIDAFVRAGRGLQAAHDKGLVHRDFKPDNVMIDAAGRVRVMDFGVARADSETPTERSIDTDEVGVRSPTKLALALALTQRGALVGTPAYMAPEQLAGAEVSAATDQFAFCVSLWEALYLQRPFAGDTLVELASHVLRGDLVEPPAGARVPRWIRRVLQRGLAVEAGHRWPSMEALLLTLSRGRTRAQLRKGLTALGAASVIAVGAMGWKQHDLRRRNQACEAQGASIESVWNDERRSTLRDALVATKVSYAETTADKLNPWVDEQVHAWTEARTQACLWTSVDERWDDGVYDRSVWCLDERSIELDMLLAELSRGDTRAVHKAVVAVAALSRVEPCLDTDLLASLPALPADGRDAVRAIRVELFRASALGLTGAYDDGLAVATSALASAEALGWPPLVAAARARVGHLLGFTGAYGESATALEAAYFEAANAGATEVAVDAAEALVHIVGYRLARHGEGLIWSRHAEVQRAALPDPAQLRSAIGLGNRGKIHQAAGSHTEARVLFERALAILETALGPDHPEVASGLTLLANVHAATGAYAEARALHERALAIREQALGPDHPVVADSLTNLANARWATGAYAEAQTLYERALEIRQTALGPEHPSVAQSLHNIAAIHYAKGSYAQARRLYERTLVIAEKALGADHPDVANTINNLAVVHQAMGEYAQAKALYERSLASARKVLGPDHVDVATSLDNIAKVHFATGAYAESKALHERALVIYEKALGPDHPDVAIPLVGLALIACKVGRPNEAVPLAERAVALRAAGTSPAMEQGEARFVLARALWESAGDRSRAITVAEQARDAYRDAGETSAKDLAKVNEWLTKHGRAQ